MPTQEKKKSENKKDFSCHRDPGEQDIPLTGTSFFSYKHPLSVAVQWNDFKIFVALSSSFQYTTILLGKLWQPRKLLEFLNTSNLASYELVSYKKECIVQYAIKKLIKYSLNPSVLGVH